MATKNSPLNSPLTTSRNNVKPGAKSATTVQFKCPICENLILEAVGKKQGQDAVQCDGDCATWLHRRCAGLTYEAFKLISKSDKPFYCSHCRLNKQELEINSLRDVISNMSSQLTSVCKELADHKKSCSTFQSPPNDNCYASPTFAQTVGNPPSHSKDNVSTKQLYSEAGPIRVINLLERPR